MYKLLFEAFELNLCVFPNLVRFPSHQFDFPWLNTLIELFRFRLDFPVGDNLDILDMLRHSHCETQEKITSNILIL